MEQDLFKLPEYNEELFEKIANIKSSLNTPPEARTTNEYWKVTCGGKMKGGCIIFGGWIKVIPDCGNKYAYCAYGGLGIGGWNHDCAFISIYDIDELYDHAVSCMLCSGSSLPDDPIIGSATDCVFFDKHSKIVAIACTDAGVAALVGGTVKWKKK